MIRVLLCTLIVVCCAFETVASEAGRPITAIVSGGSTTKVGGTVAVGKVAAFPGDDIETLSAEPASITLPGASITVLGNSHIKLRDESADLFSGGVIVSTSNRFVLKSDCFSVQPTSTSDSRYAVVPEKDRVYVRAERGTIMLNASKDLPVDSGRTAVITSCGKADEKIEFVPTGRLPKIVLGATAGAGAAVAPFIIRDKSQSSCGEQPISAESPSDRCR